MKKTGLIITLVVVALMVTAITIKLASQEESGTTNQTYQEGGEAGKLTEGMVGITQANFDEKVTNAKGLVVVDFFAPTCGYCIKYTPVFSSVFTEYKAKATFGKFDLSKAPAIATELEIKGTPTTIFFNDGKEVDRIYGFVEADALKAKVESALK